MSIDDGDVVLNQQNQLPTNQKTIFTWIQNEEKKNELLPCTKEIIQNFTLYGFESKEYSMQQEKLYDVKTLLGGVMSQDDRPK